MFRFVPIVGPLTRRGLPIRNRVAFVGPIGFYGNVSNGSVVRRFATGFKVRDLGQCVSQKGVGLSGAVRVVIARVNGNGVISLRR